MAGLLISVKLDQNNGSYQIAQVVCQLLGERNRCLSVRQELSFPLPKGFK
jgi:hypothetical protein